MTQPLAIQATYVDWKRIKTRAQYQLIFEVPEEQFDEVMRVLGAPHFEKWVGIAPLNGVNGEKIAEAQKTADVQIKSENPPINSANIKTHGEQAKKLVLSGFFKSKDVCKAVGTDEDYLKWIRTQPSAISGDYDWSEAGGFCEACHVRRANEAGTGYKPPYSAIPLTHKEHHIQTTQGEVACLENSGLFAQKPTVEQAKEWFDTMAAKYREEWSTPRLKEILGVSSLKYLEPKKLYDWCNERNLTINLPSCYKNA